MKDITVDRSPQPAIRDPFVHNNTFPGENNFLWGKGDVSCNIHTGTLKRYR